MINTTIALLSFSTEIINQVIANFDLAPGSEDAISAICLALTSRRLYNIVLTFTTNGKLKSLCPKPKHWWFLPGDYNPEVQDRLMRHWKETTRVRWMKAVPYLKLLAKLKDGSMNVMEDQGYVFDGGKAIWINPQSAARRSVTQKVIFGWSVQGEDAE